jgi:LDH2 family malate/lactate/ureidoglycolate dehydrogenase
MDTDATRQPRLVALSIAEARALGARALRGTGYTAEEIDIIVDHLLDADLCGYRGSGLAKILAILENPKMRNAHGAIDIVHETPSSAMLDGANMVGYVPVFRAAQIAIEKGRRQGMAIVGVHNAYFSGRNAYYLEHIAKADLVGIHTGSTQPRVAPLGGRAPALGTNPIAIGMPSTCGPVIFDIGTAAMRFGETNIRKELGELMPEGTAIDREGRPTRDPATALAGCLLPFGGHRGYVLSFAVQALGLLCGATRPRGQVQDYGFLFIVVDPDLMLPVEQFKREMAELVERMKATPRAPGADEIRIPSERAFRERERRLREDRIEIGAEVHRRLLAV